MSKKLLMLVQRVDFSLLSRFALTFFSFFGVKQNKVILLLDVTFISDLRVETSPSSTYGTNRQSYWSP